MIPGIRLLWADDQQEFVTAFRGLVDSVVGSVHCCADGESAFAALETFSPDVMLIDLQMPPGDWGGLWLLRKMGPVLKYVPTIVVSGQGSMKECIEAQDLGALRYVEKEQIEKELPRKLEEAIRRLDEVRASADYVRLRQLERTLHALVVGALCDEATRRGEKSIFLSLVPKPMALKLYERMLDNGSGAQEEFMDILDLAGLIDRNWTTIPTFQLLLDILHPRAKADRVSWIVRLNETRKLLAHPLRGELGPEDRTALARAEEIVGLWTAAIARG
jgi:FixJ family two-component response regulator